jgi:serine protease Do
VRQRAPVCAKATSMLSLGNTEIADVKQFNQVAQKAEKAKAVSVLVRRGEAVNYLVIRPTR